MRWTRLHIVVLLASIMVITTLLVFMSNDATASRQATTQSSVEQALARAAKQQITIPLHFEIPADAVGIAAPAPNSDNWLKVTIKRGDSLAAIFRRHQLNRLDLHQIMQLGNITATLKSLRIGQILKFRLDSQGQLQKLIYDINKLESLQIKRLGEKFEAETVHKNYDQRLTYTSAPINSSLFEAGKTAGMPDALIMDLVGIFGWDIDFAMDIHAGDHFSLLYQEQFLEGKKVKDGPIVAAEFTNQGRTYRAVRYTDAMGRSNYFTPDGLSMRKAFLRTPVDFRRISSRFGNRRHPVLNRMRLHKGVDYAAKAGTPIKAAGDGKVVYRGRKGGYGKTVIVQHGGRYSTLYAHMSRFKKGVYSGKRVKQGQTIGYVGSTGRATGSHLHYEFRVNGVHRNPLTVRLPNAAPIDKQYLSEFTAIAGGLVAQLDMYKQTRLAMVQ